ncbi:MAG: glycosyltransferase [Chloroflexota bacterium]|nr:glycosyltransferase [Chloroflexota bacterium]
MTDARPRVVLVYSRVGGGHLSAARALAEALEGGGATTQLVDVYLECARFPVSMFPRAYAQLARHHPRLWSILFHASNSGLDARRVLGPFLRTGLRRLIHRYRPRVVLSVLPVVNGLLAEVARTEVVLTDWHSVHRFWVAPGVAHYTAPTESARHDCIVVGAPADAVDAIGIPVRRGFVEAARRRSPGPGPLAVLVMVGAEGSPRALESLRALLQAPIDGRVTIVCGRNDQLQRQVRSLPSRLPVEALGFVEDVPDLMRSADLLITKAGGVTLAEAFCCGLPTVVYDVLPGQEQGNLSYALRHGAVMYARTPAALARVVADLFSDPVRRDQLAQAAYRLARPDAAARIAARVLARL